MLLRVLLIDVYVLSSDRIDPGWKANLQLPPKDNRIKTSVSIL